MKICSLLMSGALVLSLVGCAAPPPPPPPPPPPSVVPGATTSDGTARFVAEGEAVAKADTELEIARAAASARTVAIANLLGKVKGFRTKGTTTVGDLLFVSQEAYTKVNGMIARADVSVERVGDMVHRAKATLAISEAELVNLHKFVNNESW